MVGRRCGLLALVAMLWLTTTAAGQPGPKAGRPLSAVLEELAGLGLHLVYSSAVVTPSMRVESEPTGSDPRAILDEVLAPHGLRAADGPDGTLVIVPGPPPATRQGGIRGIVVDPRGSPVGAEITVRGPRFEQTILCGSDGTFAATGVPTGAYDVIASAAGFVTWSSDPIRVGPGSTTQLRIELSPMSVFLSEVVVTPSHYRLLHEEPESRQFLSREEVRRLPHVADDLYRAVQRLPGTASSDYSARFNIRGGVDDELLVVLDGLELYEPFHLKDFQNVFSIIDSEAVGGVDLLTGGFPARYGDRMSGVMDISLLPPTSPPETSVEVGTINGRVLSRGSFDRGAGGWMVSARAWYPAVTAELVTGNSSVLADYYDLLATVRHRLGRRSSLSANVLAAYDDLGYSEADAEEVQNVTARYGSYHAWFKLETDWSDRLRSQTVLSAGRLRRQREGGIDDIDKGVVSVHDHRSFTVFNLGQDWSLAVTDRQLLSWGFDLSSAEAEYDYAKSSTFGSGSNATVVMEPDGVAAAIYASDRFQPTQDLIVELGLRWDHQSWTGESELSPRLNLAWRPDPTVTLRAAWGLFRQSQRLNELQIEDGVTTFAQAQLAEHWTVSVERSFSPRLNARLELYHKDFDDLRPRYENLFNPIELFPEAESDRIRLAPERGRARGLELAFKGSPSRRVSWWAGYTLAVAEDLIDGRWQPRSWDQRHAVVGGVDLDLPRGWRLNLAGTFHTGWPTTELLAEQVVGPDGGAVIVTTPGPRNAERYPSYLRIDLRASKLIPTRRGALTLILDVINLTNRDNPCCIEDFDLVVNGDGSVTAIPQDITWAPILPSLALRWQF